MIINFTDFFTVIFVRFFACPAALLCTLLKSDEFFSALNLLEKVIPLLRVLDWALNQLWDTTVKTGVCVKHGGQLLENSGSLLSQSVKIFSPEKTGNTQLNSFAQCHNDSVVLLAGVAHS